jgi:hypothetical protein
MKSKTILNLTLIFLTFVGVFVAVVFWLYVSIGSEIGAIFVSPANPANKVSFIWNSFHESSLLLFANPMHQKKQLIAELVFENRYVFSNAQWTKDGQVLVCALQDKQGKEEQPVLGIAYDFSNEKIIAPAFGGTEFKKIEPDINKLIMAHGGLDGSQIWFGQITNRLWPWQVPSGEHFP